MTGNKLRLIVLAAILAIAGVHHWVSTAPTWNLYHKYYGDIASVEAFDALMVDIEADVARNFHKYSIDTGQARRDVEFYLDGNYYEWSMDPVSGHYQTTRVLSLGVEAWSWVWDGSGMTPTWEIVRVWRDTWRTFDYNLPKTREAQFCMMGFAPTPIVG